MGSERPRNLKRILAEVRDYGRLMGFCLDFGNEHEMYEVSFAEAEELMDALWRAGCRPRAIEHELKALTTTIFGWKRSG